MTTGHRRGAGWIGLLLCGAGVAACVPGWNAGGTEIRVAHAGSADFDVVPSLDAHAALEADGVVVSVTHYARSELAVEAVARGEADVGHGSVRNYWAAASRGAPVRMVMAHTGNVHQLVAHAAIVHCSALDGRDLAIQSEGAVGTALLRAFLADRCPDALPAYLYVPQSANRAAALLAGGVRATVIRLSDVIRLNRLAPGRFRVLADFGSLWGDVATSGVFVNAEWAGQHPDLVRRYLRARIISHRTAIDASDLAARATQALGESEHWEAIGDAYVSARIWDADGGLTDEIVERSLAFFVEHGGLQADLDTDRAADLSFLVDVLADLAEDGRRAP